MSPCAALRGILRPLFVDQMFVRTILAGNMKRVCLRMGAVFCTRLVHCNISFDLNGNNKEG